MPSRTLSPPISTHKQRSNKPNPPPRLSTPTSTTAPLTTYSPTTPRSCYLCDAENPGDFSPTTSHLSDCQLCSRDFCPIHTSSSSVCSINHSTYYHERLELARTKVAHTTSGDRVWDENEAEEIVSREGVYPSVGERERRVWSSTPVSEDKMREIENFRMMVAETHGPRLVETKEFIGADIAV